MEALLVAVGTYLKGVAVSWLRRHAAKIITGFAVVLSVGMVFVSSMLSVSLGNTSSSTTSQAAGVCRDLGYDVNPAFYVPSGGVVEVPTGGDSPGFGFGEVEQQGVARAIVTVGQGVGVPEQGLVVAVATALQESGLRNLDGGDRDSVGVFQQRPSQGWGTVEEIRHVPYAAALFFGGPGSPRWNAAVNRAEPPGLLDVVGWESMTLTQAAQAVQRSGFPEAYAKHEERARIIVTGILTGTTTTPHTDVETSEVVVRTADEFRAAGVDIDSYCADTFTLASDTAPYVRPAGGAVAWGGYRNGEIPEDQLTPIPWAPSHRLRPDATAALISLNDAFRAQFGRDIQITDSYRTYAQQVAVKEAKGYLAAPPGTSNHGWGLAIDLGGGIQTLNTTQHTWMRINAPTYGWDNPTWARPNGTKPEPWHWEYQPPNP